MNEGVVFFIIFILLGLIGVTVYLIIDYQKYKTETASSISSQGNNITSVQKSVVDEGNNRLQNLKYVVDQVNSVNSDIDSEMTKNVTKLTTDYAGLSNVQGQWATGINQFFNLSNGTISNRTMPDYNAVPNANLDLIKHTSMLSGLTIRNLDSDLATNMLGSNMKICAANSTTNCIQFPNAAGNTYITSIKGATNSVVVDGRSIHPGASVLGIGMLESDVAPKAPAAQIDIQASATLPAFNVKNAAGQSLYSIDNKGAILMNNNKISVDAATNQLVIDTNNVGLKINGNLTVSGSVTYGDKKTVLT